MVADCQTHLVDLERISQRFCTLVTYLVVLEIQNGEGLQSDTDAMVTDCRSHSIDL